MAIRRMEDIKHESFKIRLSLGELINAPLTSLEYSCSANLPGIQSLDMMLFYPPHGMYYSQGVSHYPMRRLLLPTLADYNVVTGYPLATAARHLVIAAGADSLQFSQNEKDILNTRIDAEVGAGLAQLAVTLAESKKTVSMFAQAVSFLRRPLSDAKKLLGYTRKELRTPKGRAALLDKAGSLWLEARYGWRPLVFDAMNMFEANYKGKTIRFTKRGTLRNQHDYDVTQLDLGPYGGQIGVNHKVHIINDLRAGSTADYGVNMSAGTIGAFGGYDPLGTALELLPYSFVVGWFINVGDVLQSLQAYALVHQRIAWVTSRVAINVYSKTNSPVATWQGTRYDYKGGQNYTFTESVSFKTRNPRTSFVPVIGFRCNVNWAKALDGIFLLRQLLGR